MTNVNLLNLYPKLKELFNFKKGFFKEISVTFYNAPTKRLAVVNYGYITRSKYRKTVWLNAKDMKEEVISVYMQYMQEVSKQLGLEDSKVFYDLANETAETFWAFNLPKYLRVLEKEKKLLDFEYVTMSTTGLSVKFTNKKGAVRGIQVQYSPKLNRNVITYIVARYWVYGGIASIENLNNFINEFCEHKLLNNRQKEYLHGWLTRLIEQTAETKQGKVK